jgi:lysozyme family protein
MIRPIGRCRKYGISLRFLAAAGAFDGDGDGIADFDLDMDGDIDGADVCKPTRGDAVYLYLKHFWKPLGADSLPIPIGEMLFDQGVNGGLMAARKLLQRAINTGLLLIPISTAKKTLLKVDGGIGERRWPRCAVVQSNSVGVTGLVAAYRDAVRERYRQIVARYPEQQRFLNGWLARAEQLGR